MSILSCDKRPRAHQKAMSADKLTKDLPGLLQLSDGGHFFIRPLVDNLVFLDLDSPSPDAMNDAYRLQPRAVVRTSAVGNRRNFQAWYMLDPRTSKSRQASMVTRALQEALGADPKSTGQSQQGRMPGSKNCKLSLQPPQTVISAHEDPDAWMAERIFLDVTRGAAPVVQIKDGNPVVAFPHKGRSGGPDVSRSGQDWAAVMTFFETNPAATVEDAMHTVMWSAQRPNDRYYQEGTAQKAFSIVRGRQGGGSGNPPTGVDGGVSILADTLKVVTKSLAGIAGKVANVEAMVKKREAATGGPTDAAGNDGPAGETGKKTSATCQKCCDVKPRESFSVTQWGNAASKMKCKACCDAVSWKAKLQRQCAQCQRAKGRDEYSAAQWTAKSGRCKACVGGR